MVVDPSPASAKSSESLRSRVKHVSQDIIHSKWTILGGDAQAKIEELLRSIELPVLAIYSSEQRKIEAQVALRSIIGTCVIHSEDCFAQSLIFVRLCKGVPRMTFPPQAEKIHFDYGCLVKENVGLKRPVRTYYY